MIATRHPLAGALIAAAFAASFALPAQAQTQSQTQQTQDATKEPAKASTQSGPAPMKGEASAQACRDHMAGKKGHKGQMGHDTATNDADMDKACADHARGGDASGKAAKQPAKSGTQSGEMPADKPSTNK